MDPGALAFLYRLLLAHFLADFPLQPNELYRFKSRSIWGSVLHGCVFGLLATALSARVFLPLWWIILLLTVSHILVDHAKVVFFLRKDRDNLLVFLLDQALHLAFIWLGASVAQVLHPQNLGSLCGFLIPDKIALLASFFVFSAFGVGVVLQFIAYLIWSSKAPQFLGNCREWTGVVERALITASALWGIWPAIPVLMGAKFWILRKLLKPDKFETKQVVWMDVVASAFLALILGMAARLWR